MKKAASRSFYYGFGSIVSKFSGFLMLPVYTQFLSPEDYGVAGLLVLFTSFLQLVFGAQMEAGITYFYTNKNVNLTSLWTSAFSLTLVTTFVPTLAVYYFAEQVSVFLFESADYALAVQIFSFSLFLGVVEVYGLQFLRLKDLYKDFLAVSLIKVFVQVSVSIITVVLLDMGVVGVVISSISASVAAFILGSIQRLISFRPSNASWGLTKQLFKYSYPLWLEGFVGVYIAMIPAWAISRLSSLEDLGLYNLATNFAMLIGVIFWNPFFMYWQVERFNIYKSPGALQLFKSVYFALLCISFALIMGVSLMGRWVIELMADEAFHSAFLVLLPLCIHEIFRYLSWYFNFSFLIAERTQEIFKTNVVKAVVMTLLSVVLIPSYGFVGAGWALAGAALVALHYAYFRSKKFYDMGLGVLSSYVLLVISTIIVCAIEFVQPSSLDLVRDFFVRALVCGLCCALVGWYGYRVYLQSKASQSETDETEKEVNVV